MTRALVLFAVAGLAACAAAPSPTPTAPSAPTPVASAPSVPAAACPAGRATVVLVRHAEKAGPAPDTEISPRGAERARRVAAMLGSSGVTRLVATEMKRTQQTLAPLAARLGQKTEIFPAREVDAL